MTATILQNKWKILITCEILGWLFLLPMGYFRYWTPNEPLFITSTVLSFSFDIPHLALPLLACVQRGGKKGILSSIKRNWTLLKAGDMKTKLRVLKKFSFELVIIGLVLFACTWGHSLINELDQWAYHWVELKKHSINK